MHIYIDTKIHVCMHSYMHENKHELELEASNPKMMLYRGCDPHPLSSTRMGGGTRIP